MTHTLHREGLEEDLQNDYVVFAIAAQSVNAKGSAGKFARFLEIIEKHDPLNIGDMKTGNIFAVPKEDIRNNLQDSSIVHGVFSEKSVVYEVLEELQKADIGLSIVVSGLFDHVKECCQDLEGLEYHTVNQSLGIWGKREKLPADEILEVSTMCGHGMVAFNLVKEMAEKVKEDKTTLKKAAETIAKQCHCGVVNPERVEELLDRFI